MAVVGIDVAPLSTESSESFFAPTNQGLSVWGEIGSRGYIRSLLDGEESVYGPGWEDVQVGRFSFSVDSGGDRVRMIFSDYLHVAVYLTPV